MKASIKPISRAFSAFAEKHGHEILIGLGIAGYTSAIVLGITKTPAAMEDIRAATEEKGAPLTKTETAKAVWKEYVPCAAAAASATACVVGSTRISNKRLAALATAYQLTEGNLRDLKEAAKEVVGEKKAASIEETAAANKVRDLAPAESEIIQTKYGNDIFYDPWSGRFFTCSKDRIERAVALVNSVVAEDDSDILSHFYYEIGLDTTQLSGEAGWTARSGEKLYLSYGYGPTKDGRACAVLDYDIHMLNGSRKLRGTDMVQ